MIVNTFTAFLTAALLASSAPAKPSTPSAGKSFASAKQAADALVQAVASDDIATMLAIFGPSGKKIVSSGDDVQDNNDREKFSQLARDKMDVRVDSKNPHRAILALGEDAWPFPVPLVETDGKWRFAANEGLHEILMRRVGQGELDAIRVCRGYTEAQEEYASQAHDETGLHQYAQKILSTPGKRDGLAWWDSDGKPAGPIAEGVAKALEEGYTKRADPFHGYYFRVLKAQGPSARDGAREYLIQGKMIAGFALVAWPAYYRVTGVKTFIVNQDGIVYEKDLGADSAKIAAAMKAYNPDKTWKKAPETED